MKIPGHDNFEKIGEGLTASVWKAHQISLDRPAAIKILKPSFVAKIGSGEALLNEARTVAKIKHTNLISIYDVAAVQGTYYFAIEYINGPSISKKLQEQVTMPQKQALKITLATAYALHDVWESAGVIHRNINPNNIMLDNDDTIKVADMGMTKLIDTYTLAAQLKGEKFEGTANYISPEQAKCITKLDCTTDMYSLGATLYHMVTGKAPFAEHNQSELLEMHKTGQIINPRDLKSSLSTGTVTLITKLMMKSPEDRYKDWPEAIEQMKKALSGRLIVSKNTGETESTVAPPKDANSNSAFIKTQRMNFKKHAAAPKKKVAVKRGFKAQKAGTPQNLQASVSQKKNDSIPLWVHLVSWSFLALFLATFFFILTNKARRIKRTREIAAYEALQAKKETPRHVPRQAEKVTETPPIEPASIEEPPTPTAPITPPVIKKVKKTKEEKKKEQEDAEINIIRDEIAEFLLLEDFESANSIIEDSSRKFFSAHFIQETAKTRNFVTSIKDTNEAVTNYLKRRQGRKVSFFINDQTIELKITEVANNIISAEMEIKKGAGIITKQLMFPVSKLHPQDRIKWMGAASTEEKCAMKCILYAKIKNYEEAKVYAQNAGLFSKAFTEILSQNE